jgi:DNA repair protein RecO (recombination protein O)
MLVKTKGIVVRTVKYSETSLICDVFTEKLGLQTYIVSGVRKKNAKIGASLLQVMSMLEIVAYNQPNRDINRTKEIKPAYVYAEIPFELHKSAVGIFMAELIQKTVKETEPNQELFDFIWNTFQYLDLTKASVANLHLTFMVQLANYLGFMPGGYYTEKISFFDLKEGVYTVEEPLHTYTLSYNESDLLHQFSEIKITNSHEISLTRPVRQKLLNRLIQFYQQHIDGFKTLNSHEIFKEVF